MQRTSIKRRAMAAFLGLCMLTSTLSTVAQAAGPIFALPEAGEPAAGSNFTPRELAQLRAGELTSAQVEAMIEKGLTVADVTGVDGDIMAFEEAEQTDHTGLLPPYTTRVEPESFEFLVNVPRDTPKSYANYAALSERYPYLKQRTWLGPWNGPQLARVFEEEELGKNGEKPVAYSSGYIKSIGGEVYYPDLDGTAFGVNYEVTRLSYHDTTTYRMGYVEVVTVDKGTHRHLYASSNEETGSTSHFVLPEGAKITVEYSPVEYGVKYEVYVDSVSMATSESDRDKNSKKYDENLTLDAVFGTNRPYQTTNQHVSTTVTIPRGYFAHVFFNDTEKFPMEDAQSAQGDLLYGNFPLGMAPVYKTATVEGANPNVVVLDTSGTKAPRYFTLTDTYQSGEVGSANGDIKVKVVLTHRDPYIFTDDLWLRTYTGGIIQTDKIVGTPTVTPLKGGVIEKIPAGENGYYTYLVGEQDFIWSFTAQVKNSEEEQVGTEGPGVQEDLEVQEDEGPQGDEGLIHESYAELRTLTVNGVAVSVPSASGGRDDGTLTKTEGEEEDLGFAKVQITVYASGSQGGTLGKDQVTLEPYQRHYKVTFTNVTRDLVITTSALAQENSPELVVSRLDGVQLELWSDRGAEDGREKDYQWRTAEQGRILKVDQVHESTGLHFSWNEYSEGDYNARFKPAPGYQWGEDGPVIQYTRASGTQVPITGQKIEGDDGWYYAKLPKPDVETTNTSASYISIKAQLKTYHIYYLDGVTAGRSLQTNRTGLPARVEGMPKDDKTYDAVANTALVVDSSIPTDPATDRPAVFKYWVLTNEYGQPINTDGTENDGYLNDDGTLDLTKVSVYKGAYTADLSVTSAYADKHEGKIYLTAWWEPAASEFIYYVTYNKINASAAPERDIYAPRKPEHSTEYPMVDKDGKPIEDRYGQRYAATDRRSYAKVTETTVIVDFESTLSKTAQNAAGPWYKFDEFGKYKNPDTNPGDTFSGHNHIYKVQQNGEADVWLYYTLGGLTVKNAVTGNSGTAQTAAFTYKIQFTLPEDDEGTLGNESAFFDSAEGQAFKTQLKDFTGSGRVWSGTFTLTGNGASITFPDLPAGTTYTVTPTATAAGYTKSGEKRETAPRDRTNSPEPDAAHATTNHIAALYDDTVTFTYGTVTQENTAQVTCGRTFTYTGQDLRDAIKDALTVTVNGVVQNKDTYEVAFKDVTGTKEQTSVIDAATYTVTVSGTYGSKPYTASAQVTVGKATPDASWFDVTPPTNLVYNGNTKSATVKPKTERQALKLRTTTVYQDEHYPDWNATPQDAGKYKVGVMITGTYQNVIGGSIIVEVGTFTIQPKPITSLEIRFTGSPTYDGTAKKPSFTVTANGLVGNYTLVADKDYTAEYKNNVNAGTNTASVSIKSKAGSNYTFDGTVEGKFTIDQAEIHPGNVSMKYNGQETTQTDYVAGRNQQPTITVTMFNKTLTPGTDYTVDWNGKDGQFNAAGEYHITVQGKGNYTGTVNLLFTIGGKSISTATVTVRDAGVTYNREDWHDKISQYVTVIGPSKTELVYGTDYRINTRRTQQINAGTYYIQVQGLYNPPAGGIGVGTGTGGYSGTKGYVENQDVIDHPNDLITFTVHPVSLNGAKVTLKKGDTVVTSIDYTGGDLTDAIKAAVSVELEGFGALIKDTDYTVTISPGQAGGGNIAGKLTDGKVIDAGNYTISILPKSITVGEYNYTNFSGQATATFTVARLAIAPIEVDIEPQGVIKDGVSSKPPESITVTKTLNNGSTTLVEGRDYRVEYFPKGATPVAGQGKTNKGEIDYTEAGTYPVLIIGQGNYTGTGQENYIIGEYSIVGAKVTFKDYSTKQPIDGMSSATYNGQKWNILDTNIGRYRVEKKVAATFSVEVTGDGAKVLDYINPDTGLGDFYAQFTGVNSSDPDVYNAGEYKVRLVGMGSYSGMIEKIDGEDIVFTIRPFDLSDTNALATTTVGDVTFTDGSDTFGTGHGNAPYRGQNWDWGDHISLEVKGAYNARPDRWTLSPKLGTDYTITFKNTTTGREGMRAVDAGAYDMVIEGRGNYTGTVTKKNVFTIDKANLSDAQVTARALPYTGKEQTPDITVTMPGIGVLTRDVDYRVVYTGQAKGVGSYNFRIEPAAGNTNFTGSKEGTFDIIPVSLTTATVTLNPTQVTYDGGAHKPNVTVTLPSGAALVEGTDYRIIWVEGGAGNGDFQGYTTVGSHTVTVQAIEGEGKNCTGRATATFTIQQRSNPNPGPGPGTNPGPAPGPGPGSDPTPTPSPSPSPSPEPVEPPIIQDSKHGSTAVFPEEPVEGDQVTVQPNPELGYVVDSVEVRDAEGNILEVTDNGDGTFGFTQPSGQVTIDVDYTCGQTEFCPVAAFHDAKPTSWYHEGIHYCLEHGLMVGATDDAFEPNVSATRAMIVTVLWRLEGSPAVAGVGEDFEDVPAKAWYAGAVRWAVSEGIVVGVGKGLFRPNDAISRQDMATIFYRYSAYKGYDVTGQSSLAHFDDADKVNRWATAAIAWAVDVGLFVGSNDGEGILLYPANGATRAEMATLLSRFCQNIGGME